MFKQKNKIIPTSVKRAVLLVLPVALLVCSGWAVIHSAAPVSAATSNTINFQARLLTASGNVVPDGYYNVEFKIYRSATSSGSSTGSCAGDTAYCLWTETRTDGDKVRVANGYLTVNLGSVTAFPGSISWDQQLWLTMNIGGTGSATWDGEMNPRLKLTATPYSFASGRVVSTDGTGSATVANGETGTICIQNALSCGFIQLQGSTPGTAQTGSFAISGTGVADKLQATTSIATSLIDTPTLGGVLSIGTTNATGGIALNQNTTLTNKTLTITASNNANAFRVVDANSAQLFNIDTSSSYRVSVGSTGISGARLSAHSNSGVGNSTLSVAQVGAGDVLQLYGGGTTSTDIVLSVNSNGNIYSHAKADSLTQFSLQQAPSSTGWSNRYLLNVDSVNGFIVNNGSFSATNMLQNPGFESGPFTSSNGTASGWTLTTNRSEIIVDSANARTGNNLMRVSPNSSTINVPTSAYFQVQPGEQYYAEAWYKAAAGTTGTGFLTFAFYDKDRTNSTFNVSSLSNTTTYTKATHTATVPAGRQYMRVFIGSNDTSTSGTWYFDDVYASRVSIPASQLIQNDSGSALRVQNAAGSATVFNVDTTSSRVAIGQATAGYMLDVNGDINIAAAASLRIGGSQICTTNGCVASASTAIRNQNGAQQATSNFWISGTGRADTALQAPLVDTATSVALNIGTTNATAINLNQNVVVAAGKSIVVAGGNTGSRPTSPAEGAIYFDTTTKQLLVYANGKWQADRTSSTKTVAMGDPAGCTGSVPLASNSYDAADYLVTSCTSAQTTINSAITALSATGGTVYIMEGTYIIDGAIALANNVHLVGAGQGTVLKFKNATGATVSMISASSINRIKISNMRLDGNRSNNASATTQTGIALTTVGSGIGASAVQGAHISGVTVEGFLNGLILTTATNVIVSDSYFAQNTLYAIDTNTAGSRITLTGNEFHNNTVENLGSTYWTITGNTFDTTSSGSYALDLAMLGAGYHTVSGNTFTTNGINVGGSHSSVTGNTIITTNQAGITIGGNTNVISGNKIHDTAGSTLSRITVSGSNNTISNNDITAVSGTGYAINITSSSALTNILSGNRYSGTGASSINDNGRDTVYNGQSTGTNDIVIRGMAGLGLNTTTATASVSLQGGLRSAPLPSPGAPTVTKQGTHSGAAIYTYAISATDGLGETFMSGTTQVTAAQTALSGSVFNRISWSRVGGTVTYKIYRTATSGSSGNSATVGLIGTVNAGSTAQFDDTGMVQSGSVPTANTTGGAYFAGGVTAANGLNIGYATGNIFTIQGPTAAFLSVNAQNGQFALGETGVCSIGRFCVGQFVTGTGGSFQTNHFSYQYIPATVNVGGTTVYAHDIVIEDSSTVSSGTRGENVGLYVDFTSSTNGYSRYSGLRIMNKSSTSATSYGGNAIQVDNGSTTTFSASNTGAVLIQNTANSTALLDVKNASGTSLLNVNSSASSVNTTATFNNTGTMNNTGAINVSGGTFTILNSGGTKGYRFRTDGSGLDLQATGNGVAGELWLSGYDNATAWGGTQVPFFRMMAYNRSVFVGDGANTSTPTLLVVASKTDSATDPSSAFDGAMYYNTTASKMRCYERGAWGDCMGIPKPNTRRSSYYGATSAAGTFGAGASATMSFPQALMGYGDSLSAMGNGGSTITYSAPTSGGAPGSARLTSAPTLNNGVGTYGGSMTSANANPNFQAYASVGRLSSYRMFVGLSDASTIVNQTNTDTPTQNYIGFRASSTVSGVWNCVNDNASGTPTVTATSVSVVADGGNRFEIIYDSGNRIIYKINNAVVCTHTAKLPASSVVFRTQVMAYTTSSSSLTMNVAWVYTESDY